jgi:hypothetical protein
MLVEYATPTISQSSGVRRLLVEATTASTTPAPTGAPTEGPIPFYLLPNETINLATTTIVCRGTQCGNRMCTATHGDAWYGAFTRPTSPICVLAPSPSSVVGTSIERALPESLCEDHYDDWVTIRNSTACGECTSTLIPFPGFATVHVRARNGSRTAPTTGVAAQTRQPLHQQIQFDHCSVRRAVSFACSDVCPVDCTFTDLKISHTKNATCHTGRGGYRADWRDTITEMTFLRNQTVPTAGGVSCKEQRLKQLIQLKELGVAGWCDAPPNEAADNVLHLSFRPGLVGTKEKLMSLAPNINFCIKEDQQTGYCPTRDTMKKLIVYTSALGCMVALRLVSTIMLRREQK